MELDWTITVASIPTAIDNTALFPSTSVMNRSTRARMAERITFTKKYKEKKMNNPLKTMSKIP
jgi:hypothetical protein